ncbi:unnamed protein product, partial [marine sediment metagenome]
TFKKLLDDFPLIRVKYMLNYLFIMFNFSNFKVKTNN